MRSLMRNDAEPGSVASSVSQSEFGAVHHSFGNDSLESNGVRSISVDRDFDLLGRQIRLFSVESQVGR